LALDKLVRPLNIQGTGSKKGHTKRVQKTGAHSRWDKMSRRAAFMWQLLL